MRAVAAAWSGNEASLADSRHDRRADSGVSRHRSRARRRAAPPPTRLPAQVTLVLAPYLTWDDISPTSTPAIWRLAEQGALAGRERPQPGPRAGPGRHAARGRARDLGRSMGAARMERACGLHRDRDRTQAGPQPTRTGASSAASMAPARIAYLGLPMTAARERSRLGRHRARHARAGGSRCRRPDRRDRQLRHRLLRGGRRSAAARSGRGDGCVGSRALRRRVGRPARAVGRARRTAGPPTCALQGGARPRDALARAHKGPVVRRARRRRPRARSRLLGAGRPTPSPQRQRAEALTTLDDVVAMADAQRGTDDVVIVASQALFADADGAPQGLGPLVISGPGYSGYATSSSTHRRGLVTNLDITATVLDALGLRAPGPGARQSDDHAAGPGSRGRACRPPERAPTTRSSRSTASR